MAAAPPRPEPADPEEIPGAFEIAAVPPADDVASSLAKLGAPPAPPSPPEDDVTASLAKLGGPQSIAAPGGAPVTGGPLAPTGGTGARGRQIPVLPDARGAQPFQGGERREARGESPTPDTRTFHDRLQAEAKRLAAQRGQINTMAKELDVANGLMRDKPFEFGPERLAKVTAKFERYHQLVAQQQADETRWQTDYARYLKLPAGSVPTSPAFAWSTPHAFSQVGNYQQILDKMPKNAPPERRRQAQIALNQARVGQAQELTQQIAAHDALVRQINTVAPELKRLRQQAEQGKLTPATVTLLNQQLLRLRATAQQADLMLGDLKRTKAALDKWDKQTQGKWIHNGQYFPWELNDDGTPKEGFLQHLFTHAIPLVPGALDQARAIVGEMQKRGEYPATPLPPGPLTADRRDQYTQEKNALWGVVGDEWDLNHGPGGAAGNQVGREHLAGRLANLTPYQRSILDVTRQQYAGWQKALQQAGTGKAFERGAEALAGGFAAGGIVGELVGGALLSKLGPAAAELITGPVFGRGVTAAGRALLARALFHGVVGAPTGAAAAGATTFLGASLMGAPLPKATMLAIKSLPAGAVAGAGASALLGPAIGVGGEAAEAGAAEVAGARRTPYAEPPPGAGTTGGRVGMIEHFTPEEMAAREAAGQEGAPPGTYEKRTPPDERPQLTPTELAEARARFGNLGSYTEVEALQNAADRATADAALAARAEGRGAALQFEEPAAPAPRPVAPVPAPETAAEPVGATLTSPEGETIPYRTLSPEGVNTLAQRFGAAVAQGTLPLGQQQDAVVAQALARDVGSYQQQRLNPPVPWNDRFFVAQWETGRLPGKKQFDILKKAAQVAERRKQPDLAERLNQAAAEVRRDALFDYGSAQQPLPPGTVLEPPLAAPYRSFSEEELRQIGPQARQALLLQDIGNSLRVSEPAAPGVYALNQVAGATPKNLQQIADEQFARAGEVQGARYSNIPVPQTVTSAAPLGQAGTPAPAQQVSPAGTAAATAPPPSAILPPGPAAAAPSLTTTEAPLGTEQPERAVSAPEAVERSRSAAAGQGAAGLGSTAAQPAGTGAAALGGTAGTGAGITSTERPRGGPTAGTELAGAGVAAPVAGQRSTGGGSGSGGSIALGSAERPPVAGQGGETGPRVAGERSAATGPRAEQSAGGRGHAPVRGVSPAEQSPLEREGLYTPYQAPASVGGKPHPAPMVETRSLAAVERPALSHTLLLPEAESAIASGRLSSLQLEAATVAGQRHEKILGDGARAGFLLGDSTGAGKTGSIAAIIADNWERGRRKTVWLSTSPDLAAEAAAELKAIGYGHIPVKLAQKFKGSEAIPADFQGIIFCTYASLITTGPDSGTFKKQARRDQLQRWLGNASDGSEGIAVFDESHLLRRSMKRGAEKPSLRGAAALKLQQALPGLRVVYSSATAASELGDMGYMSRLGLWGRGTAFPTHAAFAKEMAPGGTTMLEMIGRDLKAQGAYLAREISFEGTEFEPLHHGLTLEQRAVYNQAALFWQGLEGATRAAAEGGNLSDAETQTLLTQYWMNHQRFFRELLTAFKIPTLLEAVRQDLAEGRAPVISLLQTGEARDMRLQKQALAEGADLEDLDFSPAEIITQFVENQFPVGSEAIQRQILQRLTEAGLNLPQNPLDEILMALGHENVAELSGRRSRRERNAVGELERVNRPGTANREERAAFMKGEKPVALITKAAGTGFSLHAARSAGSQGRRVQYLVELNWSADDELQRLGRTHRTDQVSAPLYRMVTTDAAGEARFAATMAQRLAALGAITRGERLATGGGNLAQYDVENDLGRQALEGLMRAIGRGEAIEGLANPRATLAQMGLSKATSSDRQNVKQFLNRLMGLEVEAQNALASEFFTRFEQAKAVAVQRGLVDPGVRVLPGTEHRLGAPPMEVYTHPTLGTRTLYYRLEATNARGERIAQHLLTGAVLPIWDQLKIGQQRHFYAYRVTLPDGQEIVGVGIAPNTIKRVLSALGRVTLAGPVAADMELDTQVMERRLPTAEEREARRLRVLLTRTARLMSREQDRAARLALAERVDRLQEELDMLQMRSAAARAEGVRAAEKEDLQASRAQAPAVQAWVDQFTAPMQAITRDLAQALLAPEEAAKLVGVGPLLERPTETGVTMGMNRRRGNRHTILIAPFVPTVTVLNGRPQATWKTENNDPEMIAGQVLETIIHELAHLVTPEEGAELDRVQDQLWQKLWQNEPVFARTAERLYRLFTGGSDGLARAYREGRTVYVKDAGTELRARDAAPGAGVPGAGPGERGALLRRLPAEQREAAGSPQASDAKSSTAAAVWKDFDDQYSAAPIQWGVAVRSAKERAVALMRVHQFLDPKIDARLSHMLTELGRRRGASMVDATIRLAGAIKDLTPVERKLYDRARFLNDLNGTAQYQMRQIKEAKPNLTDEEIRRAVDQNLPEGREGRWTLDLLTQEWKKIQAQLAAPEGAKVATALRDVREMYDQVVEPYLEAMARANGRKVAFDREEYMHHEVMFFQQVAQQHRLTGMSFAGEGKPMGRSELLKSGEMRRGFLQRRMGSKLAYLTDPVATDLAVLSQMLFDTYIFEIKQYLQDQYDESAELFKAALAINHDQLFDWLGQQTAEANQRLQQGGRGLTEADVFGLAFRPKQETGYARLLRLAAEGVLPDAGDRRFAPVIEQLSIAHWENAARAQQEAEGIIPVSGTPAEQAVFYEGLLAYMQWLGNFESGKEGASAARRLARASNASRAQIREALANQEPFGKVITPEHLIRAAKMLKMGTLNRETEALLKPYDIERFAELTGWRPGPSSPFRRAWGVQDRMADALMLDGLAALGIDPTGSLAQELASQRQEWSYLPERIVATLSELAQQQPDPWLHKVIMKGSNEWRSWIILGPTRLIADFDRRQAGHWDVTVKVHPSAILEEPQAFRQLTDLLKRKRLPQYGLQDQAKTEQDHEYRELLHWVQMGGLQTTYQQFMQSGRQAPTTPWKLIPKMEKPGVPLQRNVFTPQGARHGVETYFQWAERFQDFAEAVWRYSHYRAYLKELRATWAAQGGPEADVRPKRYDMAVASEIDALPTLEQKAFALSDALLGAFDRISSGSRIARQKFWDIPFYGFKEATWRKWGNLWINSARSNGDARALEEQLHAEIGQRLMSGGGSLPELPPPEGKGPGDEEYDDWQRRSRLDAALRRANQSRWRQILALLRNGKLTALAVKAAILGLGATALRLVIANGAIWSWNHYAMWVLDRRARQRALETGKPYVPPVERLPEHVRNRGWGADYVIWPFNTGGRDVYVFNRVGTDWEVLHQTGLDDVPAVREAFHNGGLQGVAAYIGDRLINSAVESIGPTKTVAELITGLNTYPDVFNPRPIPNRLEFALDTVAAGNLYRSLRGKPQPEGRSWVNMLGANQYDGREQNYLETMDWMRVWKQYQPDLPKGVGSMAEDDRSAALYQFKKATRQGLDGTPYLKDYLMHGGTVEGLKTSFQRLEPLYGLNKENYRAYRERFLLGGYNALSGQTEPGLTSEQQARIRSAYWYVSDLAQPAVSGEARKNQAKLPILPFVDNMEKEIKGRMDRWLDNLVKTMKANDPELQHRLALIDQAKKSRVKPEAAK